VEEQDGGVDAEERVPTQRFRVPVLEVEGLMRNQGRGVDERLVVRGICESGAGGRPIIRSVCDREVGERGDTDRWRLGDGSDGRVGNRDRLWDGGRFGWWGLRDLRISVGKPEGCGDESCSGVSLVRARRV